MNVNNQILSLAIHDDVAAAELIGIARKHCKLALEHGMATTYPDRRKAIIKEIESLRGAKNAILERFSEREGV